MRIFFDTEFTNLTPQAKLVSIGLIDESGMSTFYAELSDTYTVADCSYFCLLHILPLLERGGCRMLEWKLHEDLFAWLSRWGPGTVLVCNSPRDLVRLAQLFPEGSPSNCSYQVLGMWGNLKRRFFNFGRRLHKKHGLRAHHALDDAKVNGSPD